MGSYSLRRGMVGRSWSHGGSGFVKRPFSVVVRVTVRVRVIKSRRCVSVSCLPTLLNRSLLAIISWTPQPYGCVWLSSEVACKVGRHERK